MSNKEVRNQAWQERQAQLDKEYAEMKARADHMANIRGILFVGVLVLLGLFLTHRSEIGYLIGACAVLVLFIVVAIRHGGLKARARRQVVIREIHEQYMARAKHDFSKLTDNGADLKEEKHPFSGDLDLFGEKSLYHLISVAHTTFGRAALKKWLVYSADEKMDIHLIESRQQAVAELASDLTRLEELEADTKINSKKKAKPRALLAFLSDEAEASVELKKTLWPFMIINTILMWGSLVAALIIGKYAFIAPAVFFVLQILLMALDYKNTQLMFTLVEKFFPEIRSYSNIFSSIEKTDVKSEYLVSLKEVLLSEDKEPEAKGTSSVSTSMQLQKLYRIGLFVQARMQPLLYTILNLAFPYDPLCIHLLEKWKKTAGKGLEKRLELVGEWEALMSFSTLSFIYPDAAFPKFVDSKTPLFRAKEIGHPLIPENRIVRNDFSLEKGCCLITGSNMSGKTTLLRTVGINCILAYTGAVCPAASLELTPMRVGASMRIEDNLGEGVSTFYAELLKIERIVKLAEDSTPLLYLIDEIFRGTNSRDRTDGAWTVLKKLNKPTIIGLMSTHDYELCKMNDSGEVNLSYAHFSEYYDDDGLHFDYKLKEGMSTETNAKYLMKLVGIED